MDEWQAWDDGAEVSEIDCFLLLVHFSILRCDVSIRDEGMGWRKMMGCGWKGSSGLGRSEEQRAEDRSRKLDACWSRIEDRGSR